jgi:hypothetical protein
MEVASKPAKESRPWMLLSSGKAFDLLQQDHRQVDIRDIANHLAKTTRFGGATRREYFYSVAQHSVHVAEALKKHPPLVQLLGLLHDAHEAYIGDQITPCKKVFEGFDVYNARADIETVIQRTIHRALRLPERPSQHFLDLIQVADMAVLATEVRDICADSERTWTTLTEPPLKKPIVPWTWQRAEEKFLQKFNDLSVAAATNIGA